MLTTRGLISQEQKEQILKAVDIVQLISDYVLLKPSGKNYVGLCPFHQEKTPSFTVSPSYQNYKCYGCGESGDSIRFIMGIENLQFVEAVGFLAERSGILLDSSRKNRTFLPVKSEIDQCLELSFTFFRKNLKDATDSSTAKTYLHKRSISKEMVESFQLGFVEPGWQNLNRYLLDHSVSIETQEKAGLIKKGEKGGHYDRLRNRLIFPIRDKQNRLLGFAGRSIDNEEPKYLNPPETDLYKKSAVVYGIEKALNQIRRKRRAILVEGYLDVIRLHEFGWLESIAICGTAVTKEHIISLKNSGAEETILLFDGDSAGIKAAVRTARLFIENDLDSKVVVLPEAMDPDDYFKKYSNQDFQNLLDNAVYDFEFIITRTRQEFSSKGIKQRENLIKEVINLTRQIQSSIKKDLFLAKAAEIFQVDKKKLQQSLIHSELIRNTSPSHYETSSPRRFEKEHLPEVRFLQYLMNHGQAITMARSEITQKEFIHDELSEVYARFLQLNDEEFKLLKAKEFPEFFVEFSEILMYLLHYDAEYKGPPQNRASSEEMMKLKIENERLTQIFSEQTMGLLINRLKNNRTTYDIKRMRYTQPEEMKESLRLLIESRKKNES
jgi:DNA primase